jgi:hypothetical protein
VQNSFSILHFGRFAHGHSSVLAFAPPLDF